jgi:NADPH:quinone reductase-like Zn-dependent oxidoreductase
MRAAQITDYGDKSVVRLTTDALQPKPAAGQVLVAVHAAGVNPFDWKVREGQIRQMAQLTFPATLGGDCAGEVTAVGEGVTGFAAGDAVYGQAGALSGSGSFAEYTVVPAAALALKPKSVDDVVAAAMPLAGSSAYQALADTLHVQKGQKILIHGGAGGIGGFAIQLAKYLGAYVATTVQAKDAEYVKSLGADEAIDYQTQQFEDILHDYDAVYDLVGGDTCKRSYQVLRSGGRLVSMVEQPDAVLAERYGITATRQSTHVTAERLTKLAELVDQGDLQAVVDKTFPLEEAGEAMDYVHSGRQHGKIVIKIK